MVQQQLTVRIPEKGTSGLIWKQQRYWRNYLGKRYLKSTEIYIFFSEGEKDSSISTNIVGGANKPVNWGLNQRDSKREGEGTVIFFLTLSHRCALSCSILNPDDEK